MIKEERVRKIYAVFVVILISLSVIFIIFQNSQLNYLYEERLNSYERVVGYLVSLMCYQGLLMVIMNMMMNLMKKELLI